MNQPSDGDAPDASDAPRLRLVLSRPEPDETVEEFSARFFAEILHARQLEQLPDGDRDISLRIAPTSQRLVSVMAGCLWQQPGRLLPADLCGARFR